MTAPLSVCLLFSPQACIKRANRAACRHQVCRHQAKQLSAAVQAIGEQIRMWNKPSGRWRGKTGSSRTASASHAALHVSTCLTGTTSFHLTLV